MRPRETCGFSLMSAVRFFHSAVLYDKLIPGERGVIKAASGLQAISQYHVRYLTSDWADFVQKRAHPLYGSKVVYVDRTKPYDCGAFQGHIHGGWARWRRR